MDMITLAMAKAYTDKKAGYSEMTEVVVLPEITLTSEKNGWPVFTPDGAIVLGETYIVKYDGVEYECEAHMDELGLGFIVLGNGWFLEGDTPSGLPFCIATDGEAWVYDDGKPHTISCVQRTETIHPIDPKYIPAMDSLTLNGADGKQYKVTVNASGVLTATAL